MRLHFRPFLPFSWLCLLLFSVSLLHAENRLLSIGVAKIDITPDYPVRLSGYGVRTTEYEGIDLRLWAKAMAFGDEDSGISVLVTVDNTGVPGTITEAVFKTLAEQTPLKRENFDVASTQTHEIRRTSTREETR